MKKEFLEIGKIVGTHGIRGEVRVELWCDSGEFFSYFKKLYLDSKGEEKLVVKSRPHKNIALMKIKDIENIDDVLPLVGKVLYMDRNDCPLPDDVYFVQDIIGCEVRNVNDNTLYGKVTDVLRTGANDVYQVEGDRGVVLIPKIDDIVKSVDVDRELILIEPMEGLFNED